MWRCSDGSYLQKQGCAQPAGHSLLMEWNVQKQTRGHMEIRYMIKVVSQITGELFNKKGRDKWLAFWKTIMLCPYSTEYTWTDSEWVRNLKSETVSARERHAWNSLKPGWRERSFKYESNSDAIKEVMETFGQVKILLSHSNIF